ncbi:SufD family Fe-S cluster assembly protein [Croceicoccus sp. F390]|uniref:SufD family Fe-S cluster assembly protein n=1 Tax=Croceicoccus esteveae TaxID=3075597 RepID=A0ABU2ZFR1_9SPHN|nr:SufD family Fe-S cluster assembly protein [Croceicoccus sp. F390]MDT0575437.1 SufD family Fe-S cluster assembly protein [Croceicoccus sp. F390]
MTHAHLPTLRDEEWRYGNLAALQDMDVAAFENWRDIDVAAGEAVTQCFTLDHQGDADLVRVRVKIGPNARCSLFAVNTGGRYSRMEIVVRVATGGHFEFGGVTIGGGDATREFVTRIAHDEPGASSNQIVRAVHWGKATGNFLGRIDVVRDAQKTNAAQDFKAILLEKGATANAKPELEIFADDVKCAHGAAIGALDQTAAFYMAARGLPPELARKLQIRAFIADAFVALDDEAAQEAMLEQALAVLEERK